MAEKNVKETLEKKKALEAELKALEERLGTAFTQIKDDVEGQVERTRNSVSPAWWVRKYPVYVLGAALFAGFLLAPRGSRSGREQASDTSDVRTEIGRFPHQKALHLTWHHGRRRIAVIRIKRFK